MDGLPLAYDAEGTVAVAPSFADGLIDFTPSDIARHAVTRWNGLEMDSIELVRREPYEHSVMSASHVLIMKERGERDDGETFVEGLPKSTLRDFSGRLSFIPRGRRFRDWARPRVLTRATFFMIDPRGPLLDPELGFAEAEFKPRLFFHDPDLWAIAAKLKEQSGRDPAGGHGQYVETLGILLGHELLLRLGTGAASAAAQGLGGLAGWQRHRVADYVEAHLADTVSVANLAALARLSPFHFSRAFKQSFGTPPHHYLLGRRIARAKAMLADKAKSVTEVGAAVGFAETSGFTATFRKHTGVTPTAYRRSLD